MAQVILMAVHAHPDDESSKGAATYAKYAAQGDRVVIVSCTGGESGDILTAPEYNTARSSWDLPGVRHQEMERAQQVLGVEHLWLGYRDSGMPPQEQHVSPLSFAGVPLALSIQPLVAAIRRVRPHVVVTYDERGGYPHPDHIRCHEVTVAAIEAAARPEYHRELGEPWQVLKLYYERTFTAERMAALAEQAQRTEHPQARELSERVGRGGRHRVTTHIPVADFLETRDEALRQHRSQVSDQDTPFFFVDNELQRAAWPWEDFELVWSRVGSPVPESDLFAGVRTPRESPAGPAAQQNPAE